MSTTMSPTLEGIVDPLRFRVTDVTGQRHLELEMVDGYRTAGDVALTVAELMELPTNSPWALRDEGRGRMLDQDSAVGGQIGTDAELVVIPRSHLG
ncbi:MAG: hypothetical protein AB7O62_09300 [Pirellulales bacterium]